MLTRRDGRCQIMELAR